MAENNYCKEVEKILDVKTIPSKSNKYGVDKQYLIKWKSISYSLSTWEYQNDFNDDLMIEQFNKNQIPPTSFENEETTPSPSQFKVITENSINHHFKNSNKLRPYQLDGLNWLSYCWHNKKNNMLCDETGLGKTIQIISILEILKKSNGIHGPFLVIAPLSTIQHWKKEFENWSDLNVLVYQDSFAGRQICRDYEFYYNNTTSTDQNINNNNNKNNNTKFNVLITTYEMAVSDREELSKIHWKYLIVDDAHHLKIRSSKISTELRLYNFDHLTLLTGTPIQNSVTELWSLLNFLEPNQFSNLDQFLLSDINESSQQLQSLQAILGPCILRRMKEDVAEATPQIDSNEHELN